MRDPFRYPQPLGLPADFRVAIVGTGFAGLAMAIALKKAGFDGFTLYEKNSGVGGTWLDNSYPGAACDVQSQLYSYSFELNPNWTRHYAPQREILAYVQHCVAKYNLSQHIRLNSEITSAHFDEARGLWTLNSAAGEVIEANAVISGCGGLSRPAYPRIAGLDSFAGTRFHTARWDHDYDVRNKSVAVIGTGASAIQVVPAIAPQVKQLTVYQRTPPWIVMREDGDVSPFWRRAYARAPLLQQLARASIYWRLEARVIAMALRPELMKLFEGLALRYIAQSVPDPQLRAKLTPDYTIGCKRVLLSNDYYPALSRDNVELVTDGIEQIEPSGILSTTGERRQHDCLILATGFIVGDDVAPFPIYGRDGQALATLWEPGAEAFKGTTVSGFPNLFMLVGPNTGLGHSSMIFMIESQVRYAMSGLRLIAQRGLRFIDVRQPVQAAYNKRLHRRLEGTVWQSGCSSWYRAANGKNTTLWPGFTFEFRHQTRELDAANYELRSR